MAHATATPRISHPGQRGQQANASAAASRATAASWPTDELRLVVDLETAGAAEPEYDLRTFPGPAMGPGVELLTSVMRHYQQITGRQLSAERITAWHLRTALGDALWRSEAGIPLADHRIPPEWVDDLAVRFSLLGIDPETAPAALRGRK